MRALFYSLLGYFLTPFGLVLMGALDSSLVFFLPLGIDFVVIILTARHPELFWLYAILATVGSLIGAALTFWIGRKVGEHGLSRLIKPSRLKRIQQRVSEKAAVSVAALAIIPPPFPFTAFVLTSGAFRVNPWSFFLTLSGVRLLRFMVEGALAAHYGRGILAWMESTTFTIIISVMIALAVIGTVVSGIAVYRGTKKGSGSQVLNRSSTATPP
ncbi:MAG: VTT domain-containing protein [Acidobacteriota bacterium]|jgi:membrane protein YqaA with SNARE-associated domain|nr:VTT domain-containing protein [Acidobacteriota bacterium]